MRVTALYVNTLDNMEMMDRAAEHIFGEFGSTEIGTGTFLPTSERDLAYDVPDEHVAAVKDKLVSAGFRVADD